MFLCVFVCVFVCVYGWCEHSHSFCFAVSLPWRLFMPAVWWTVRAEMVYFRGSGCSMHVPRSSCLEVVDPLKLVDLFESDDQMDSSDRFLRR